MKSATLRFFFFFLCSRPPYEVQFFHCMYMTKMPLEYGGEIGGLWDLVSQLAHVLDIHSAECRASV